MGMQLEAGSATLLPRGAILKRFLSEKKENVGKKKQNFSIRHRAQKHVTRSYSSKQHSKQYHVRDARRPYCILRVQIATKHLVEQQRSIDLIDTTKRRRLRGCRELSSIKQKQQHTVQARIAQKLRWHETSAEMPNKISITRRYSYSFRSR